MSISVGTLTIEMAANVARLQKDMAAAKKTVNDAMTSIKSGASSAMNALAGLGVTLSVAAFAAYIKGASDAADKLNDLSKATAISVQNLSGLDLAATAAIRARLRALAAAGAAVLVLSSDLDEVEELAGTVAVLFRGRLLRPASATPDRAEIGRLMAGSGVAT